MKELLMRYLPMVILAGVAGYGIGEYFSENPMMALFVSLSVGCLIGAGWAHFFPRKK